MANFEKTMAENAVAPPQRNPHAIVQQWDNQWRGSAIVGMTRIWERLYLGSLRDAAQLAAENPFGINTVLSLCSQKVPYRASRIRYTRVPIADSRPISARQFDAVMGAISEGVRNGNLLIHCVAGVSRSPIMTAAWLRRCGCLNLVAALLEIAKRRPIIDPSPVLLRSVAMHLRRPARNFW
jgi:hypothetical protein